MPFDEFVTARSGADLCVLASALNDASAAIHDSVTGANDSEPDPLKALASDFQHPQESAEPATAASPTPPPDLQHISSQVPEPACPQRSDAAQPQQEGAQQGSTQAAQAQELASHPVLSHQRGALVPGGDVGTGKNTPAREGSRAGEQRFSSNLSAFGNQWHTEGVSVSPSTSTQVAVSNRGGAQGSSRDPTSALPSIAASPAAPKATKGAPTPGNQSNLNHTEECKGSGPHASTSETLNGPLSSTVPSRSESAPQCTAQNPCTHASCVTCSHTRLHARMQGMLGSSRPESPVDDRDPMERLLNAIQNGAFVDEAVVPVHKFLSPIKTKCPPQPAMNYVHCYPPDEPMAKSQANALPRPGKQGPSENPLFHDERSSAPLSPLPSYGDVPSPVATPTWRLRGKLIPTQLQQCLPQIIGGGGRRGKGRSARATQMQAATMFSGCFPIMLRSSKLAEAYDDTASIEGTKTCESERDGARTAGARTAGDRTAKGNPVSASPPLFRSTYHNPFFQVDDTPAGSVPVRSPSQKPSDPVLPASTETVPGRSGVLQVTEEPVGHSQKSTEVVSLDVSNAPAVAAPKSSSEGVISGVQAAKHSDRRRSTPLTSPAGSTTCPLDDKRRASSSRPDGASPVDTSVGVSGDGVSRSSSSAGGGGATGGLAASLWARKKWQHRSKSPLAVQDSNDNRSGTTGKFWRGIRNRIMHVQQASTTDSDAQASEKSLKPGASTECLSRALYGSRKSIGDMHEHHAGDASAPVVFAMHANTAAHSCKEEKEKLAQLPHTLGATSRIGEWWQKLSKRPSGQDDEPYEPPEHHSSSVAVFVSELKSSTSHESEDPGEQNRKIQNGSGAIEPGSLGSIFQTCH